MIKKNILYLVIGMAGLFSCSPLNEPKMLIIKEISEGWEFREAGTERWLPATVPGTVHTDLLNNKIIEDPYYRLNEKKLQWIDKSDWEYRTVFTVDAEMRDRERMELVFEGLDTYADIFLNGGLILQSDNMFRSWAVDVSGKVRNGENELRVVLESPTRRGLEALKAYGFQLAADNDQSEAGEMGGDRVSPYVRKAPYHFGWDWGPRLVTSGIWRPVRLRAWSGGRILDADLVTEDLSDRSAELTVRIELDIVKEGAYDIGVSWDSIPFYSINRQMEPGINRIEIPLSMLNPRLWQPNGLGVQNLYTFRIELTENDKVIDATEEITGLRKVNLIQEPDSDGKGRSFYFEVNGKPVFAKGANYIPNDVFLNRVSPEQYEFIVKSAADAHMNMLRVWGGGIYENDIFYDLCDKYGIMVWQDFMFACAMYPGNDEFLENVRQEAIENVKRLRNHPCIVLWCGNNEIEAAWGPYEKNRGWGWKQRYNEEQRASIWKAYDTLFHKVLPEVIRQEDPDRPYWHSSPSAGMGQLASYETASGDMHYWGVWHGLHPLSDFRKYHSRFMSEYGFQSFPEFNSVRKYTVPDDYSIESEVMMSHQRSGIGNLRIRQYMERDYAAPADFEQFLYTGQLLQAEAIKMAIESHRADLPYCMGSLYWQLNDCWPVASWSGIDWYGRWKALHYFVKESFKPVILVCQVDDDLLKLEIISDIPLDDPLELEIKLMDFNGKLIWRKVQAIETPSQETPSHEISFSMKSLLQNTDPRSVVLVSDLKKDDDLLDRDLHYFVKPKDLNLQDPKVRTDISQNNDRIEISVSAESLAKNVFIYAEGLEGQFSDNYFDVLPGQTFLVTILKTKTNAECINSLQVLHLLKTENLID
jgi:beta-mannosidase